MTDWCTCWDLPDQASMLSLSDSDPGPGLRLVSSGFQYPANHFLPQADFGSYFLPQADFGSNLKF